MSLKNIFLKLLQNLTWANEFKLGLQDCCPSNGHQGDWHTLLQLLNGYLCCISCVWLVPPHWPVFGMVSASLSAMLALGVATAMTLTLGIHQRWLPHHTHLCGFPHSLSLTFRDWLGFRVLRVTAARAVLPLCRVMASVVALSKDRQDHLVHLDHPVKR